MPRNVPTESYLAMNPGPGAAGVNPAVLVTYALPAGSKAMPTGEDSIEPAPPATKSPSGDAVGENLETEFPPKLTT